MDVGDLRCPGPPTQMTTAFPRFDSLPSPIIGGVRRHTSNRRFATATCASLLLHVLFLTAYDQRKSADDGALWTATWSHDLSVTLRFPPSSRVVSDQDMLEKKQTKVDARPSKKDPTKQIDGGNESASIPSQIIAPISSSRASDNAIVFDSTPTVDVEGARHIARQMARAQGQNLAQQLPRRIPSGIERETPLGQAIARSSRSDCRTAYAGAGLFAIPFLIRDAVTDSGCKW